MVPSRHLWLGNITQKPTDEQVLEVFATFGKVDSGGCPNLCSIHWAECQATVLRCQCIRQPAGCKLSPAAAKALLCLHVPSCASATLRLLHISCSAHLFEVLNPAASLPPPPAVRVFPAKAYAFVNYADVGAAVKAMHAVDGLAIPQLTGGPRTAWEVQLSLFKAMQGGGWAGHPAAHRWVAVRGPCSSTATPPVRLRCTLHSSSHA